MDSFYISPNNQDSYQQSSNSDDDISHTATQLLGLNIIESSNNRIRYQSCLEPASSRVVDTEPPKTASLSSSSNPQSSAPPLSSSQVDFDWTFGQIRDVEDSSTATKGRASGTISEQRSLDSSSNQPATTSANMSTIGIQQYDAHFDAGLACHRSSYAWPNFDVNLNHQFFSSLSSPALQSSIVQFDEPKLLPMYARSNSSSPRGSFTPEQRELKKQRDFVRRDSKARFRRESSASNNYTLSQHPSPALVAGHLSGYSSSLSPSPLLSHVSPAMPSTDYMTSYASQAADTVVSDLYAPGYTVGPSDFSTPAYDIGFTDPLAATLQSHALFPQTHSISPTPEQSYNPHQHYPNLISNESNDHIRVVQSRPKPQCWDHGCKGRQFSTFSNLLRHQREKSGVASKSSCPNCGAEFTRTTARNGHMAHEKCKQRRNS